jgi:hypothetical protein
MGLMMAKTKKPPMVAANSDNAFIDTIKKWQQSAQSNTARWELQQLKWHKMRMRIKKVKNFPFVGCANFRMPTLETKIRKLKASLVNVIFGIRPVVQVIPTPSGNFENAMKVEKFLDHLICDVTNLKQKIIISIDQALEKGWCIIKPYWAYEEITRIEELNLEDFSIEELQKIYSINTQTEDLVQMLIEHLGVDVSDNVKNVNMTELRRVAEEIHKGTTAIKVNLQDVTKNHPDADTCMDERVYVGTDSGYDPQNCQWIIHEFFMPLDTVKKNAEIKGWDTSAVTEVWAMKQVNLNQKNIQIVKDFREGIMRLQTPDELVKIWEVYCWYDINNDGVKEKCAVTVAADFYKIMRKSTLPFDSAKWPFVKLFYELTDDRWFSHRGIPEMIEDIVKEIDIQHMQKVDNQTIRNSPMFLYRAGMVNNKVVQFVFGQGLPVNGMTPLQDVLQPVNNANQSVEFSYEREQMLLESKIEELIGQVDFTLQSMINKRQPRTLGEVQLQVQNQQAVFSLDAALFITQIEELFNWIWDLWCQYGDDEYEFAYFGKEGWEKIRLSREEVQGKYKITVRGNDQNTNPQVRLQKAQAVLAGMENPLLAQMGVITPINVANALKLIYQELDIANWQELVTFPQPRPQIPPPPPPVKMGMDDLTPQEQAQVKAKYGIQPDVQGMALKHQEELGGVGHDHEHALAQARQKHGHEMQKMIEQHNHEKDLALLSTIGGQGIGGEEPLGAGE